MCSNCGSIVKKSLSEKVHECPYCGFVADQDYNAAENIHRVGMEQPFEAVEMQGISKSGKSSISRAVEMIHLYHISVLQGLSMKPEAGSRVLQSGVVHLITHLTIPY